MLVNIYGAKCIGIDATKVTVEVDIRGGVGIHLVGLADTAVKESLLRTVTALQAMGYHIPGKKIIINLAPADLHKSGSGYDLPIALGIIAASGQRTMPRLEEFIIMGELGLDGSVREIAGALPFADMAAKEGFRGCIFPLRSALEASDIDGSEIYGVETLEDVLRILEGGICDDLLVWNTGLYRQLKEEGGSPCKDGDYMDFAEIVGHESAKRGAEIAAAGAHNLIMIGPPGSGKSSIAKAIAGILPPMNREEALTTSKIYSVAGRVLSQQGLIRQRPFRAPHYSASIPALIGGGSGGSVLPGEVSLAQGGVLFVDEFAQLPKGVSEALRGPLEDRKVTISRLRSKIEYPSSFMLVAASNPCPCGYWGDGERCTCSVGQRLGYLARLSGPIMDRIDLQVWMHAVEAKRLVSFEQRESTAQVARRVARARRIQRMRFEGEGISTNAQMSKRQIDLFCPLSDECKDVMETLIQRLGLSARAFSRILKLARTIADLSVAADDSLWAPQSAAGVFPGEPELLGGTVIPDIRPADLYEAASYRFLDRRDPMNM